MYSPNILANMILKATRCTRTFTAEQRATLQPPRQRQRAAQARRRRFLIWRKAQPGCRRRRAAGVNL